MGRSGPRRGVVLGLHTGHDGTAALVIDGRIVAAVGEERLSRTKQHYGFPFRAIRCVLNIGKIDAADVDVIALGGGDILNANPWQVRELFDEEGCGRVDWSNQVPRSVGRRAAFGALKIGLGKLAGLSDRRGDIAAAAHDRALRDCGLDPARTRVVDHHLCHAMSAYGTSPFEQSLAITIDGYGDGVNTAIWDCSPVDVTRLAHGPQGDDLAAFSPGDFYSYVTCYLGFKRNRHEGKVTGLAAYASAETCFDKVADLLQVDSETAQFFSSVTGFQYSSERRPHVIARRLSRWAVTGKLWDPTLIDEFRRRVSDATSQELAAAAQMLLEIRVVELISHWVRKTGQRHICLAGGVFANVKLNQRIAEIDGVDDIFIHPCMGDGGLSVGAALWASRPEGDTGVPLVRETLKDAFLGPGYSTEEIREALDAGEVEHSEEPNLPGRIARALHEGLVVARFDGRVEYGPRALGNRSILVRATDSSINDSLNKRLRRTEFMPFAPMVLHDRMADLFIDTLATDALRFMTVTLDVKPEWIERIPAVCHVDGTARPQVVDPESTPFMHAVVAAYDELSGLPAVINTSFNMHEEPIVCTPQDAIRTFAQGHLDALAIGPFWVQRPEDA